MGVHKVQKSMVLGIMAASILGVVIGFKYFLPLFLPFVFGYFLAWLAAPIVTVLTLKCHIPRGISSFLVVITFVFVLGTSVFFLIRAGVLQCRELIESLPEYEEMLFDQTESIGLKVDRILGLDGGTVRQFMVTRMRQVVRGLVDVQEISGHAMNAAASVAAILWNVVTMLIAALLIVKEYGEYKESFHNSYFYKEIHMVTGVLSNMGIAYLKAQFIMMCIIAAICTIGLALTGNRYALIAGIGIAVFDAFPILGSAFILIPWCIFFLFQKRMLAAVIVLGTYVLCLITRQILEPKLVGDRIGIKPVYTLISMYVGIKVYGAFGFILGPISLVAIKAIVLAAIARLKGEEKQLE